MTVASERETFYNAIVEGNVTLDEFLGFIEDEYQSGYEAGDQDGNSDGYSYGYDDGYEAARDEYDNSDGE